MVLYGRDERYWNTLPVSLIAFAALYPGFRVRLYHSADVRCDPRFAWLERLADLSPDLELVLVDRGYVGTEPTLWRILPLWDPSVEVFFCRDLDSAPTWAELRAVTVFMQPSSPPIHGIRGHRLHNTLLMAGLCGFRSAELDLLRRGIGCFDHYWHIYLRLGLAGRWGCDQTMLAFTLGRHAHRILDCPFHHAPPLPLPVVTLDQRECDKLGLPHLSPALVNLCDRISALPGQPLVESRSFLPAILKFPSPLAAAYRTAAEQMPALVHHWLGWPPRPVL